MQGAVGAVMDFIEELTKLRAQIITGVMGLILIAVLMAVSYFAGIRHEKDAETARQAKARASAASQASSVASSAESSISKTVQKADKKAVEAHHAINAAKPSGCDESPVLDAWRSGISGLGGVQDVSGTGSADDSSVSAASVSVAQP